jgi:hypothetical protein
VALGGFLGLVGLTAISGVPHKSWSGMVFDSCYKCG